MVAHRKQLPYMTKLVHSSKVLPCKIPYHTLWSGEFVNFIIMLLQRISLTHGVATQPVLLILSLCMLLLIRARRRSLMILGPLQQLRMSRQKNCSRQIPYHRRTLSPLPRTPGGHLLQLVNLQLGMMSE